MNSNSPRYERKVWAYLAAVHRLAYLETSITNSLEDRNDDKVQLKRLEDAREKIELKLGEAETGCILHADEGSTYYAERDSLENDLDEYDGIQRPIMLSLEKRIKESEATMDGCLHLWKGYSDEVNSFEMPKITTLLKSFLKILYSVW